MAIEWFCKISGKQVGPLSPQQLKLLADKGKLRPEHQVRQGANGSWFPAIRVKGLFFSSESGEKAPQRTAPAAGRGAKRRVAIARAAPLPPGDPGLQPRRPAAQPRPIVSRAPGGDALNIVTDDDSPTSRLTGRTSDGTITAQRKRQQKMMLVGGLATVVLGLAVAAVVVVFFVTNGSGEKSEKGKAGEEKKTEKTKAFAERDYDVTKTPAAGGDGTKTGVSAGASDDSADDQWHDASKPLTRGEVVVTIRSAEVAPPAWRTARPTGDSQVEYLMVDVAVENTGAGTKPEFKGWSARSQYSRQVKLSDDVQNTYKPPRIRGATVEGQLAAPRSLYRGKPVGDLLVFEPPVEAAEHLLLELPAAAFGEQGTLKFKIPREMINRRAGTAGPADDISADVPGRPKEPVFEVQVTDPDDPQTPVPANTGQDLTNPLPNRMQPEGDQKPDQRGSIPIPGLPTNRADDGGPGFEGSFDDKFGPQPAGDNRPGKMPPDNSRKRKKSGR